jgi:putative spermidine/putrescine transport system permease protein
MKRNSLWSWIVLVLAVLYFALPLIGTFEFSLKMRRGVYSFDAYRVVLSDPRFQSTFLYSVTMALCTIVLGIVIVVPTAYWVRLKLPRWRPIIEFITLLPLVIPPIVVVFGYIRLYNTSSWLPLTGSAWGTNVLLAFGYATLSLPYMYRAVDTGLRAIDVATLTEAEFVMAALLSRPAFGPYMQLLGANRAYEPAALAVIAFAITWLCMGLIQLVSRFSKASPARI